jgi:hypothetical protein
VYNEDPQGLSFGGLPLLAKQSLGSPLPEDPPPNLDTVGVDSICIDPHDRGLVIAWASDPILVPFSSSSLSLFPCHSTSYHLSADLLFEPLPPGRKRGVWGGVGESVGISRGGEREFVSAAETRCFGAAMLAEPPSNPGDSDEPIIDSHRHILRPPRTIHRLSGQRPSAPGGAAKWASWFIVRFFGLGSDEERGWFAA